MRLAIERHLRPDPRLYALGVATALASLLGLVAGLLSTAATLPTATGDFAADGAAVSAQQAGNLRERVLGSHEAVDLLPFFSAEVLVHRATSTWRFKAAIMSTHPQPLFTGFSTSSLNPPDKSGMTK